MSDSVRAGRSPGAGRGSLPIPPTSRGRRTRSLLVRTAREVFEEKGYLDAVVADIAQASGVAHGTFYKYFTSKEDVFRVVALELQEAMIGGGPEPDDRDGSDPGRGGERDPRSAREWWDQVERTNRRYLSTYRDNARMISLLEQVATFNDEMLSLRREIRAAFVHRSTRALVRMQHDGLVHDDLDARYVASALGSMVDRFAYVWLVLGEDFELEQATTTLTTLWARAVGLAEPG